MLSVATLGTVRGWTASDIGMILGDFRQAESPLGMGGAFRTHMHPDLVDYCITEIGGLMLYTFMLRSTKWKNKYCS